MGHVVKGTGRVIPGVMLDARTEAKELLTRARAEADALRAAGRADAEHDRREGFDAGRAEGLADAAITLAAARAEAMRLTEAAVPTIITLASKMAERIVGRAVELQPAIVAEIAEQALAAARTGPGTVEIRVHPADLAAVTAARPALVARAPEAALELVADETLARGGCLVETANGRVDARLETQLAALERALAPKRSDLDG